MRARARARRSACTSDPGGGGGGARSLRVVAGANERSGLDVAEAEALGVGAQLGELRGRPPTGDRQVLARRPEVLPERQHVDADVAQVGDGARTSSAVSPMPRMMPDLVSRPASAARPSRASERKYAADGRAARCSRATVSRLWFRTSGRAANNASSRRDRLCSRGSAPRPASSGSPRAPPRWWPRSPRHRRRGGRHGPRS